MDIRGGMECRWGRWRVQWIFPVLVLMACESGGLVGPTVLPDVRSLDGPVTDSGRPDMAHQDLDIGHAPDGAVDATLDAVVLDTQTDSTLDVGDGQVDSGDHDQRVPDVGPDPDIDVVDSGADRGSDACPQAAVEACNGLDDDCDGMIDESFAIGSPCEAPGTCGAGVLECADEVTTRCSSEPGGSADGAELEMCNALDDDCDGMIDEGANHSCYAGPEGTLGVGACRAGLEICQNGQLLPCADAVEPQPDDDCDRVDDDCDGRVDEVFQPGSLCSMGICRARATPSMCVGGVGIECVPGEPAGDDNDCNEIDDDCDGRIDEHFGAGEPGGCGIGVCQRNGLVCINGAVAPCVPGPPTGDDSDCDGEDDDCDGQIDEAYVVVPSCGLGGCAQASIPSACVNGVERQCVPGVPHPDDAQCDGIDSDCDGRTDEDYLVVRGCGVGQCSVGSVPSSCRNGVETRCLPRQALAQDLCDGLDGDCDGQTDEDYQVVASCGVGFCAVTAQASRCEDGVEIRCIPGAAAPTDATCDAIDDDCDGHIDENFAVVGCGLGVCRTQSSCVNGVVDACTPLNPEAGDDALCDGRDSDCDGQIDEDYVVQSCGQGVCERSSSCNGGVEARCLPGPALDFMDAACDGLDGDCDGTIDEDAVALTTGELRLTLNAGVSVQSAMVTDVGGFTVVWTDSTGGTSHIWTRQITAAGVPRGNDTQISPIGPANASPDLAWAGNGYGVVYTALREGNPDIYFRRLDVNGNTVGNEALVDTVNDAADGARIVWGGGSYGITWNQGSENNKEIWFRRVSANGVPQGRALQLTATAGNSLSPVIAWTGTEYGVFWAEVEGGDANLWFARINGNGQLIANPSRIVAGPGNTSTPDVIFDGQRYALTWSDTRVGTQIYFARFNTAGIRADPDIQITTDPRSSSLPSITRTPTGYGIAWNDSRNGGLEIYATQLSNAGEVGAAVRISNAAGISVLPRLRWNGVTFGVVWYDNRDINNEIYFGAGPFGCP